MTTVDRKTDVHRGRWAAAAMFLINGFVVGSWAPQIPGFVARLGIGESVFGLLVLGFGIGALSAMALAGQLVARLGSRRTLRLFVLPVVLMLPLLAQTSDLRTAAVVLFLFGGAIGGMDVAMNANVVAVERQMGRAIMSSSHGFWSLGGFLGGGLGGIAIQAVGPFDHALAVGLLAAAAALWAGALVAEDAAPAGPERRIPLAPARRPAVYVIGAMALLCMSAEGSVLSWSALYLQNELLADGATAGFAFAAFSGAMALTRFGGDGIRNRFGAVATFRLSGMIAAAGMLVVGLSPGPSTAIAAFALCGVGVANLAPILFSAAGNQPGLNAGVSMSIVTTMGHSGILLAPSIIGFAGERIGLAAVYVAVAVLLGVISLAAGRTAAADSTLDRRRV